MKKIFNILVFIILVQSFTSAQDYFGIYGGPNFTQIFVQGLTTAVNTLLFSHNTTQSTPFGTLGVSASISGTETLVEPPSNHPEAMFGGQSNNTAKSLLTKPLIVPMNDVGTPLNSYYVPAPGFSGINVTQQYAFEHYVSTEGFLNEDSPTLGSYYVGTITYTFTQPVSNPVFHITGLGGFFSSTFSLSSSIPPPTMLFSVDFVFQPNAQATAIQRLSGTTHTVLTGNTISNNYTFAEYASGGTEGVEGNDGGSGSFQIVGVNITTVTFNMIMVGKVQDQEWSTIPQDDTPKYSGDRFNTTWTLPMNTLPVNLKNFTAIKSGESEALLIWNSGEEVNFSHYEVEVSENGTNFEKAGQKQATGSESTYSWADDNPFDGDNFYRLKLVDSDGSFKYSDIRTLRFDGLEDSELSVYPNPTVRNLNIEGISQDANIKIFDSTGKLVLLQKSNGAKRQSVQLNGQEPGTYIMRIEDGSSVKNKKIILIK